jgi:HlyD family secretion protein
MPPAALAAHASGKIRELFVTDNQTVAQGEYLAVIDNPARTEDVQALKQSLSIHDTKDTIHVPRSSFIANCEPALGSLQSAYNAYSVALFNYSEYGRLSYYPQKEEMTRQRIKKYETQLQNLIRQQDIQKQQFELSGKQFARDSLLHVRGVVSTEEYEKAKSSYLQNLISEEAMQSSIDNMKIQIADLKESLFDTGYNDTEKANTLKTQLQSAEDQLRAELASYEQAYVLVSPVNGKITFTKYWTENQNVTAGEEIFTVVPDNQSEIIGKAQLPTARSGKVKEGQRVNIHLDNFPDTEFGTLRGTVKNISKVPVKEADGIYYTVEISLPNGLTTTYNKTLPDLPDFQGRADIVTDDVSLLERFFQPIRKIWTEGRE